MAGYHCPMPLASSLKLPNCILSLQTAFCLSASSLLGRNKKREGTSAMEALSLYAVIFMQ
jgi:hypothetical protein